MLTPAQEDRAAQIGGYRLPVGLMAEFNDAWDNGDQTAIQRASDKIQNWKASRGRPSAGLVIGGVLAGLAALGGLVYLATPAAPVPPPPPPPPPPPSPSPGGFVVKPRPPKAPPPPVDIGASSAGGLLLAACKAKKEILPEFTDLLLPNGLTVHVMVDAIRGPCPGVDHEIRLPVSYRELVTICNMTGCLPLTAEIADLFWQWTSVHMQPVPVQYLSDPKLSVPEATKLAAEQSVAFVISHNENLSKPQNNSSGAVLPDGTRIADVGKDWILSPLIAQRPDGSGAVEYGWRELDGTPRQPISVAHGWDRFDYANACRLMSRTGTYQGQTVQLLDFYGLWTPTGFSSSILAPFKVGK